MEWITTANALITLIISFISLVGAGFGAYFAIKNGIKALKEKNSKEIWGMIMAIAQDAMNTIEHSDITGPAEKKAAAMKIIKDACNTAGINIDGFVDQLDAFIDTSIEFYNNMKKEKEVPVAEAKTVKAIKKVK